MLKIEVPNKPTDRYTIDYYQLSICEYWVYINKVSCTYYVNTPYEELDPSRSSYAPLVDDWMISINGSRSSRIPSWKRIEGDYPDRFATKDGAVQEAKKRFKEMISSKKKDIERIEALSKEVEQN